MRLGQAGLKIVGVPFSSGGRKKVFPVWCFRTENSVQGLLHGAPHVHNARADACGCLCGCGTTSSKDHRGRQKPQNKAADAFPAFEKHKAIQSNPPCGCPMGCGTLYGGEGVFWPFAAVSRGRLRVEGFSSSRLQLRLWKAGLGVVVLDFQGGRVACKGRSCIPDKWV